MKPSLCQASLQKIAKLEENSIFLMNKLFKYVMVNGNKFVISVKNNEQVKIMGFLDV